jgi:hypothetical protein
MGRTFHILTKKQLVDALSGFKDDDPVVVEVHDGALYEDLYDFYVDPIELGEGRTEIRICPLKHESDSERREYTYDFSEVDPETQTPLHYNSSMIKESPTDFAKWEKIKEVLDKNRKILDTIDEIQRKKGELMWRYMSFPVADGSAIYQIIKVNKKFNTVQIEWCDGFPDRYSYELLGNGIATLDLDTAKQKVAGRDKIAELFRRK